LVASFEGSWRKERSGVDFESPTEKEREQKG